MDSPQPVGISVETAPPPAKKRFFARRGVLIPLIVVLVALLGGGGYALVRVLTTCTPAVGDTGPTCVPLPPNTTFVTKPDDHSWDYTVAQTSVDQVISFFQAQLPAKGWRCFGSSNASVAINGVTLSGDLRLAGASMGKYDLDIDVATGDSAKLLGVSPLPGDVGLSLSLNPRTSDASSDSSCK